MLEVYVVEALASEKMKDESIPKDALLRLAISSVNINRDLNI